MTNAEFIEYLKTVDTPTLANAVEGLNLRPRQEGFTPLSVRCLFPEMGRMVGYAVTAQVETVTKMERRDNKRFHELFQAVEDGPNPVVVVMQEIGGYRDFAVHAGEVMATIFQNLGAVGIVSDCAVRDLPEVRSLKMHYFARGSVASHANFRIVRANEPVQIEGMAVAPGDLIHGDENGLLHVPKCDPEALKAEVDKVRAGERPLLEFVRSKEFTLAELKRRFLH